MRTVGKKHPNLSLRLAVVLGIAFTAGAQGPAAQAEKIYWNNTTAMTMERADFDGTNVELVLVTPGRTKGLALLLRPCDANRDGEVDVADYAVFNDCLTGPNTTPTPVQATVGKGLGVFDFEGDGDVDAIDYAALMNAFTD